MIRAFRKEQEETAQFERKTGSVNGNALHVGKISGPDEPLTYIIIISRGSCLAGRLRVNVGAVTQGSAVDCTICTILVAL